MLTLLSSPVRRWILATLLLPVIAFVLAKVGLYLQRRNGGAPTRLSRALLSVSAFTRRRTGGSHDNATDLIDTPRPDTAPITAPPAPTTPVAPPPPPPPTDR